MSRVSHAARLERLKRQLRGEPELRVEIAPEILALAGEYAGLGRAFTTEELKARWAASVHRAPEAREASE